MIITDMTVLVVDVHGLVRTTISQGLTSQPAIKLVITTQNYAEAEKQTEQLSPDIIWLEMNSGHSDGIAEIRRLKKLSPASRIMAIADEQDEQEAGPDDLQAGRAVDGRGNLIVGCPAVAQGECPAIEQTDSRRLQNSRGSRQQRPNR